jgi:hypothetical protein
MRTTARAVRNVVFTKYALGYATKLTVRIGFVQSIQGRHLKEVTFEASVRSIAELIYS